jgi:hypothetical protein
MEELIKHLQDKFPYSGRKYVRIEDVGLDNAQQTYMEEVLNYIYITIADKLINNRK